jgi:hypothetical protein
MVAIDLLLVQSQRGAEPLPIVLRKEVKAAGLRHYFTGEPCCNGHVSPRRTANKACLACHRERRARVRAEQPEIVKAQKATYYRRHRRGVIAKVISYQRAHPEKRQQWQTNYRAKRAPQQHD